MINYSMKFGVSETARLLGTNIAIVKKWAFVFSDYLSSEANPVKGHTRIFSIEDIRIFAYVIYYWEEEPDIENIKQGLNAGDHFDFYPIDNFISSLTPLFVDMPSDIDEIYKGIVFGGEFELGDIFSVADSFKMAGDKLVEIGYKNDGERELFLPAIYNYRHATELYLKSVIGIEAGENLSHNLLKLLSKLKIILQNEFKQEIPDWFENIIEAFNYSDPGGTAFRYAITIPEKELYVDLLHVKTQMDWLSRSFRKIRDERFKDL